MWHAEISGLVLRHYDKPGGYELRIKFDAVAYAKACGPEVMFIEGALRTDGEPISITDWRELAALLHKQFGVQTVKFMRKKREVSFSTTRALSGPRTAPVNPCPSLHS